MSSTSFPPSAPPSLGPGGTTAGQLVNWMWSLIWLKYKLIYFGARLFLIQVSSAIQLIAQPRRPWYGHIWEAGRGVGG